MRIVLCLIFFCLIKVASAGPPELIFPKTKVIRSVDWYAEQAVTWAAEVRKSVPLKNAWLNYYSAARYAGYSKTELDKIVVEMASSATSESYEALLIRAWHEGFTSSGFENLKHAYELDQQNPSSYGLLVLMHEYQMDVSNRKVFSEKLFSSNLVSTSLLNYSYNVLMSLEKNAILFTESDNTTLPIYLLQDVLGVRTDVDVLNLDMLLQKEYRDRKLTKSNLKLSLSGSEVVVKPQLCAALPSSNQDRTFYYALTLGKENISTIKDQLYVVGLASQLSSKRIDNISLIRNNLENRFLLDYLTVDFNGESAVSAGRVLNANYLVPMLLLRENYATTSQEVKAKELENIIVRIAKESGKTLLVQNFLTREQDENVPFIPYKLDKKGLENAFRPVKDNIHAHDHEVTNGEYNAFLQYLKENKLNDLYEKCNFQLNQYEEPALSFMKNYHYNHVPTKKQKYFSTYPVINISYEAAEEYCKWLTQQYNNGTDKKYKKVLFRLPSIKEWQLAAAGVKGANSWNLSDVKVQVKIFEPGTEASKKYETKEVTLDDPEILYPWFKNYNFRNTVINHRGCALGNFKFPETQKPCRPEKMSTADGFWMMSSVQAYFPNDIGLYDVVGNVAEMTLEKGKACGGSWNHSPEESTIKSVNDYNGPSANVGFRVFMEVIQP